MLRSAGFPAAQVLRFAAAASLPAIDQLIEADAAVDQARATAIAACLQVLARTPDDQHRPIRRLIDRLRAGQLGDSPDAEIAAALAVVRAAVERRDAQRRVVEDAFAQDGRQISDALRDWARDPRFREAVVWQNRALIGNTLEPLLAAPLGATDARTRQKETMVAGYAQRYCVKNDTIGFFGPVGWARLVDGDGFARIQPGAGLLDVREVHFEYWCMDALAARLAEDPDLRRELAPRRMPTIRLDGATVHYPVARSTQIAREYVAVLAACDGETAARAIARALSGDPALGMSEDDVYGILAELAEQRLIRWTLELPTAGQHPDRHLRRALERLPPGAVRARALARFAEIDAGRAAVARAAGDATALDRALAAFDDQFSQLTGLSATRRAGQTYAGRTLIYEETHRNVELELGARFVDRLGPPLELLMISARWFTHAVAAAYRPVFERVHRELRDRTGEAAVDYLQYLEQLHPHLAAQGDTTPTVRPIVDELQARWLALLGVAPGLRRIACSAAALRDQVASVFEAPAPGWPQARYHSPDIMIAAAGADALRRGEFDCVLNELHVGDHTYLRPVFLNLHPDPGPLLRARARDLGRPVITTVETRANALRSDHFPPTPEDLDIETSDARSWRPADHVLPVAQLVVEHDAGRLCVRTRDARRSFDITEVFEAYLQLAAETQFLLLPALPHTPRVSIDGLIVARESWSFDPAQLAFAKASGLDRFLGARRWARQHGVPRFIFLRVPHETKPYFIDLESPVYVEILARLVRQARVVKISEMLPAIDETWLADAEGRTYTAELRMAIVDPVAWRPDA